MRKKFTSLQLSQNRQLRRAYSALDQLLHGILIFVSAIAQQGECVMKTWVLVICSIFSSCFLGIYGLRAKSISLNLAVILMLVFGFLIIQFYSGSIVGSLLKAKPENIKSLKQLADSSLNLGVEDIVYNKDFFNVSFGIAFSGICGQSLLQLWNLFIDFHLKKFHFKTYRNCFCFLSSSTFIT